MMLHVPGVLTPEQVSHIRQRLDQTDWIDGRASVGDQGAKVKRNRQLPEGSPLALELGQIIVAALANNPLFFSAALPYRILPPLFNRYAGGEHYGDHIDGAMRRVPGSGQWLRTDVSSTLFLSEPDDYDGGELVVIDAYGTHEVKLPAGDLILYPSTSVHHVEPVTRGERVCSFFWSQSMVRDDAKRALLVDIDRARSEVNRALPGSPAAAKVLNVYHNLLRMWAET